MAEAEPRLDSQLESLESAREKIAHSIKAVEAELDKYLTSIEEPATFQTPFGIDAPCRTEEEINLARLQLEIAKLKDMLETANEYYHEKALRSLLAVRETELAAEQAHLSHESLAGRLTYEEEIADAA